MEAQLQRHSHDHHHHNQDPQHAHDHHHYEQDQQHAGLHPVIEGESEQGDHQHHKSVLKKVKDKAKKIKDTIKKHGAHGNQHGHEGGHGRGDIYPEGYKEEEEYEDDDDEEMLNDPEVHGPSMYESTVIRSTNLNPPGGTHIDIGESNYTRDVKHKQDLMDVTIARPVHPEPMADEFGKQPAVLDHEPGNKNASNVDESKISSRIGLEDDPHSPKIADPTGDGGNEANVGPLVSQFDNLNVNNVSEKKPESESSDTKSHDQIAPQQVQTKNQFDPESIPEAQHHPTQNTMAGKIYAATGAVASTAVSAKNAVASKLGYRSGPGEGQDSSSDQSASETVSQYAWKASEKLAPVYEKVAGACGAVMSKVGGGLGDTAGAVGANRGGTMKGYLAEKFKPGDEDKALSEVIMDAITKKKDIAGKGRVTQSEEVTARLGPPAEKKREGEDALAAGAESSGEGMVDRLKDAVGAWLGKGTGLQTAQDSIGGSYASNVGSTSSEVEKADQKRD
ncbi:hypothetical protein OROGR_025794 [Orobanche gracilis]